MSVEKLSFLKGQRFPQKLHLSRSGALLKKGTRGTRTAQGAPGCPFSFSG